MKEVEQAMELCSAERYDDALDLLVQAEVRVQLSSHLLVTKGRLILLSQREQFTIGDAEACFTKALEIEPEYAPALLEMGWLYFSVYDDGRKARPYFDEALASARESMKEALEGMISCMRESTSDIKGFLEDTVARVLDKEDMESILKKTLAGN